MCNKGSEKIRRREARRGLLQHSYTEKQLPRQDDNHLAATGQDVFHKDFLPLTEGFIYVEPNDIEKIEKVLFENRCAAVMLEVVQGEGGVMPLDKDYLQSLERICRERDILLICDEVQTGNGRSGKLYSYMNYGIFPDIVSTAKGLAGGLPLGATLFSERQRMFSPRLPRFHFRRQPDMLRRRDKYSFEAR